MKKIIIGIISSAFVLISINLFAQPTQMWASIYNGLGNANDEIDPYNNDELKTDKNGFVYYVASANNGNNMDILTTKIDSLGNILWTSVFNGIGNFDDKGQAIAVDDSGNVYVVGLTQNAPNSSDFITLKYNKAGSLKWFRTYDISSIDYATDIKIDVHGDIVVCGVTYSGTYIYSAIKYDSLGTQQWASSHFGGTGNFGYPNHCVLDSVGNIYMTAQNKNIANSSDEIALLKYNSNGIQQWIRTYNGPTKKNDYVKSMAIDGNNIILVGVEGQDLNQGNFLTLKYDLDGIFQWKANFGTPSNLNDCVLAVDIDFAKEIVVTGNSFINGISYIRTIKYSTSGSEIWNTLFSLPSKSEDLVIDSNGDIYIAGAVFANLQDMLTLKYSSTGNLIWDTTYSGTSGGYDQAQSIAYCRGSVYSLGQINNSNDDIVVIKYNQCLPPNQPLSILGPSSICEGKNTFYNLNSIPGATSYNWILPASWSGISHSDTIFVGVGNLGGLISVNSINACGISTSQSLSVLVYPTYSQNITDSVCKGTFYTFPDNTTSDSSIIHISHLSTPYTCDSIIITTLIINPLPNVSINLSAIDTLCLHQGIINLNGEYPPGGQYSGIGVLGNTFNTDSAGLGNHLINYIYLDGNNCTNLAADTIYVDLCTFIKKDIHDDLFSIFPNPTNGNFNISLSDENSEVGIANMFGQEIIKIQSFQKSANFQIHQSGVYLIKIKTSTGTQVKKLIVNL